MPTGTVVYPGMSVTTAVGSTGTLAANTTVLSVSGTTVTLSANATAGGAATLLFGPISALTGPAGPTLTAGTNTFTVAPNTLGLNVGQVVTFSGGTATLPANTIVTAYNQGTGQVTLSANITGTTSTATSQTFAAPAERSIITSTTASSTTAKVLSSLGMFVGQPVQGPGIPYGTTIAGVVDANTITLSLAAAATGAANAYYGLTPAIGRTAIGTTTNASNSVTMASAAEAAGIAAGMYVQGVGIPQNTVVGSVSGTTVTLVSASTGAAVNATATHTSNNLIFGAPIANYVPNVATTGSASSGSTSLTVASATGLAVGMPVFVTNIANGTTVAAISGTTVTLSTATLGTISAGTAMTFSAPLPYFSNTYTGDTVVNQGTLNLSSTGTQRGGIFVPGNLVLNNANVTQTNSSNGTIASTSNVTINGGGTLTLLNGNTLASITFNNPGGAATPTVTGGTLHVTGAISATNDSYAFTPTIASILELNGQTKTLTVNGISPIGLIQSGVVQNVMNAAIPAGLIKAGTSGLVLGGASTFAGGVQLNAGTLIVGASSTPSTVGSGITAGPLGTGTLTIAGGTTLQPDTTARTVSNNLVVNGDFIVGGTGTNLTLNGAVDLGSASRTVSIPSPQVTATLGGIVSGSAGGLAKNGDGILTLTPTTTGALSATGAATNATVSGTSTLTLSATAAAGIVAGMPVHGTGIAPGTTVASVSGAAVTLSQAAVATTNAGTFAFGATQTYAPSAGSTGGSTLTVSTGQAANLSVGSTVTGVGIAGSTTVSAIDTATGVVTLNNALTGNVTGQNITFGGAAVANSFNTYAGSTTVSGGLLKLGNLGALPSATALNVLSAGVLDLNANNATVASLAGNSATTGGLITNSATTGIASFTFGDATSTSFGGAITNNVGSTLNVIKQGAGTATLGGPNSFSGTLTVNAGTLVLSGTNSYSGATTVSAGVLRAQSNSALGSTAAGTTVASGAALELSGGVAIGLESLSLSGSGISNGGALRNVSGANTYGGALTLAADSRINADAGSLNLSSTTAATGNFILTVGGAADTTIAAPLNVGSLVKDGSGNLTLSGTAGTMSGSLTAGGGEIRLTGTLSSATAVNVNNGGTLLLGSSNRIVDTAAVAVGDSTTTGRIGFMSGVSSASEALGALTLNFDSILDFGSGTGNTLAFASITLGGAFNSLKIYNWTGSLYSTTTTNDPGTNLTQDRLLFSGLTGLTSQQLSQITFFSDNGLTRIGTGAAEITFGAGSQVELVPVPEPSTWVAGGLLLGLLGYRERRRLRSLLARA